ncbi:MAG: HAMP domain-containing sensor histidine kinase, partial [Acidimicrobiales bacterium]
MIRAGPAEARRAGPKDGAGSSDQAGRRSAQSHGISRRPRRHLGLAARVTTTFALGALVLSGALASITYFSVRSSLISQEKSSLAHEAIANAEAVKAQIEVAHPYIPSALASVNGARGAESILEEADEWYPSSASVGENDVPSKLRLLVSNDHLAEQVVEVAGAPVLIVGVPFRTPAEHVAYFQIFNISQLAGTLRTLLGALILAAGVTTLGGAIVGRWGARRALRPLRQTAQAALSIAGGQLDTRLESDAYSDLAVLTSAFNKMADGLQERIEREARFTSDVNHELRSPLTTVATALSVLEGRRQELPERAQKALDLLSAEVRRFRRLVDDLLEISRLDAGLGDVNREEVSLGPLVEHTVAATPHPVLIDIPPTVGERRVVVDKLRFERVMANLLENADRYAGGATRVVADADDRWARVAVEDRGPGVPPEERVRIFDRFSRGTSGRRRGAGDGTGLGLAIVAEHARLLGGRVWVETNGTRGARFVVQLPVQPVSEPESNGPAPRRTARKPVSMRSTSRQAAAADPPSARPEAREPEGREATGREATGRDPARRQPEGREATGREPAGQD